MPSVGYEKCTATWQPGRLLSSLLQSDLLETFICTCFCEEISKMVMFSSLAKSLQISVRTCEDPRENLLQVLGDMT